MWIIANNETNEVLNTGYASASNMVESKFKTPEEWQEALNAFKARVKAKSAERFSIPESKVELYWVIEDETPGTDLSRIQNGDQFDAVWSNDVITGLDFTVEDNKGWVKFETNKTSIKGDGVEEATLTLTVYQSDKKTVKNVNVTKLVPINTPQGIIKASMTVAAGVGTLTFKKVNDLPLGHYCFPAKDKYLWGFRTWEYAEIDVYLEL